jgi:hypothetical protein
VAMTAARRSGWRWMNDRCTRARAATRGDGDLGSLAAHAGQGFVDALFSAGHVAAAGLSQRVAAAHPRSRRLRRSPYTAPARAMSGPVEYPTSHYGSAAGLKRGIEATW